MPFLVSLAIILFCGLILTGNVWSESSPKTKLDGYGGYKFGMTLEEADAVRPDDRLIRPCEFVEVESCLERTTEVFGEKANVIAQISSKTHTVSQILISFKRIGSAPGACKKVLSSIAGPLLETFGPKFKEEGTAIVWDLTHGGRVRLTRLCITDDTGMIVVSYEPTDAF